MTNVNKRNYLYQRLSLPSRGWLTIFMKLYCHPMLVQNLCVCWLGVCLTKSSWKSSLKIHWYQSLEISFWRALLVFSSVSSFTQISKTVLKPWPNVIKLLTTVIYNFCNMLDYCPWQTSRAYKIYKSLPEWSIIQVLHSVVGPLSTSIKLGWKGLPGTNTLAYNEHS